MVRALWGVGGMFLAIPLTAMLKVVCDRVPRLQPLGYLLGDEVPRGHGLRALWRKGART